MGSTYSPLLKMNAQSDLGTSVDFGHKTKMPPSCAGLSITSERRDCTDTLTEKDGLCGG